MSRYFAVIFYIYLVINILCLFFKKMPVSKSKKNSLFTAYRYNKFVKVIEVLAFVDE